MVRLNLRPFVARFSLCMRGNGYLWASSENSDNTIRFLDPNFLLNCEILAIWGRFKSILVKVCHISTSSLLTYCPTKCATCFSTYSDNFPQILSWYVHPLLNYSILAANTLCALVTFWPSTALMHGRSHVQSLHQVWKPYAYPFLSYKLQHFPLTFHLQPLHMCQIVWPVLRGGGVKMITYLEFPTPKCLFTVQLILGYDDDQGTFNSRFLLLEALCDLDLWPWHQVWTFYAYLFFWCLPLVTIDTVFAATGYAPDHVTCV